MDYNDSNSTTYGYDSLGNRTSADGTAYLRNCLNQYTAVDGNSYIYDANGNLTNDSVYKYTYNCENRLMEVKDQNDTAVASYKYDLAGRRVLKTVSGTTTKYVYDGDQIIAEYEDGDLARKFIYGPGIDEPVCMIVGASTYYYHFDGLGSVAALSDDGGDIIERYSYDVFGEPNRTSSIGNPYFFTGRAFDDETGNYYYRARYYKPSIGRFLQTDPIGYIGGLNLYTYCRNNPIRLKDPSGCVIVVQGDAVAVGQAGCYLWGSPAFMDTFIYLNNSSDTYTIITNSSHDDAYNPLTKTIYWDPTSALKITNGDVQSPALGLAHEMEHARNHAEGDMDDTHDTQYESAEERNVITGPEAEIATDLGEATRTDHLGDPLRVDDPTYHKEIKK